MLLPMRTAYVLSIVCGYSTEPRVLFLLLLCVMIWVIEYLSSSIASFLNLKFEGGASAAGAASAFCSCRRAPGNRESTGGYSGV